MIALMIRSANIAVDASFQLGLFEYPSDSGF